MSPPSWNSLSSPSPSHPSRLMQSPCLSSLNHTADYHWLSILHDPGERSNNSTRDWPRLACECPGGSSGGVGWCWPAAGLGALSVLVHAWDLLKEVTINFITSTIVWPQVENKEETQLHSSTENWIKDLLSKAPSIRTRPSFPLSQSLPTGSIHKPLVLLCQRADRMKTTITEN